MFKEQHLINIAGKSASPPLPYYLYNKIINSYELQYNIFIMLYKYNVCRFKKNLDTNTFHVSLIIYHIIITCGGGRF